MARRNDFLSIAMQTARAIEQANRAQTREQQRALRHQERLARQNERDAKKRHQLEQTEHADDLNQQIDEAVRDLSNLLRDALSKGCHFSLESFLRDPNQIPAHPDLTIPPEPQDLAPPTPGLFASLLPGSKQRYARVLEDARRRHAERITEHKEALLRRQSVLTQLQAEAHAQNKEVTRLHVSYAGGDPSAVATLFKMALEASSYPDGFSKRARLVFLPESRQLVVDYELPLLDQVVPDVERHRYVKNSNIVVATKRNQKSAHALYASVVAQTALRSLYEIFAADRNQIVEVITFNTYIDTIDPATGHRVQPYVLSVRTTRDAFQALDLARVDPIACLRNLSAAISRNPAELLPIRPIVDINTSDPRFIQESDILSTLDNRPNLMDLTPGEFESLITNLFQKMGLETKLTQASRDGGVDCVAYDLRPVLGGKVIIQAKRYKNTVGVSAVRDLFGTVHNEGASKGILVTTSGYGSAAFDFAKGKPLELLSGSNLIHMLKEHAGVDAKIVIPDDWVDPPA
jgi:restriction system protein